MTKKLSTLFNNKDYITTNFINSLFKSFSWQDPVNGFHRDKGWPKAPSNGHRYICISNWGRWKQNYIYEYVERQWEEIVPRFGMIVFSYEDQKTFIYTDKWKKIEEILDHGVLNDIKGGEYHLSKEEYDNLTSTIPEFYDINLKKPKEFFKHIDHNKISNYKENEHIDWTKRSKQKIHKENIDLNSILQFQKYITHDNLSDVKGGEYHLSKDNYDNLTNNNPVFDTVFLKNRIPSEPNEVIRKDYLDQLVKTSLIWDPCVKSFYMKNNSPKYGEYMGESYICGVDTDKWKKDYIYRWNGIEWEEYEPKPGFIFIVEDENKLYTFVETWIESDKVFNHQFLTLKQGGKKDEYYHLSKDNYDNVTNERPIYSDMILSSPQHIYRTLDHNKLKNRRHHEHIDWTTDGKEKIHKNRIPNNSKKFSIKSGEWKIEKKQYSFILTHNMNNYYPLITCWSLDNNEVFQPNYIKSLDENNIKITVTNNINVLIILG